MSEEAPCDEGASRQPVKLVFLAFVLISAFFLVAEHRAHVMPWLPWLLLAACPLMHLFMHHGHRDHDHRGGRGQPDGPSGTPPGTDGTGSNGKVHHRHMGRS